MTAAGGAIWSTLLLASLAGIVSLDVIRLALALALVVIVPAGLSLHPHTSRRAARASLITGTTASAALLLQQGVLSAALVLPGVVLAGTAALGSLLRWWRGREVLALGWVAALGYLTVGAAWLLLDRLGVEPLGVRAPFVALTAIHFHYAGFGATLVAANLHRRLPQRRGAAVALIAVVVSPPVIALGFTAVGVLQVVGAAVLTAGLWLVAWTTVRHVLPLPDRTATALLVVSSVAVVVPMALAVQWAVGWNFGTPALSIPVMARTHGVVNALGFTLCGILGWRRVVRGTAQEP